MLKKKSMLIQFTSKYHYDPPNYAPTTTLIDGAVITRLYSIVSVMLDQLFVINSNPHTSLTENALYLPTYDCDEMKIIFGAIVSDRALSDNSFLMTG